MRKKHHFMLRPLLLILAWLVAGQMAADVKTTYNESTHTTTVTSTDTIGVTAIPDWTPTFVQNGSWEAVTYKLTVKFDVRTGSKLSFDWGFQDAWYDQMTITLDGKSVVSDNFQGNASSHFEKMFKTPGTQTLTITLQRYGYGCQQFTVSNMKIDHDGGQGPDGMLPFHPTTITPDGRFANDVQWYHIFYPQTSKYLYHDNGRIAAVSETAIDSAYYWTFTGSVQEGFQIYNMQTGPSRPMSVAQRINKGEVLMGGEGDTRFLLADHGDDYAFYMDGDTVALYISSSGTTLQTYKPTTIWKTYNTSSLTKVTFQNQGQPVIIPMRYIEASVYKQAVSAQGYITYEPLNTNGTIQLDEDDQILIEGFARPNDATDKLLTHSIEPSGILKLEGKQDGDYYNIYATALKDGQCTLTLKGQRHPEISKELHFKVTGKVRVESITFPTDTAYIGVGDMRHIDVSVLPENAYNRNIKWSNSKPNVATIGKDGSLYGLAPGTTTLTARASDDSGKSAKLVVVCIEKNQSTPIEHDTRYLFAQHTDGSLTAIPLSLIEQKTYSGNSLSLTLSGGIKHLLTGVENIGEQCPVQLPHFTSYKFNNKFNDQLFTDAVADEAALQHDTITVAVAGIGKRLTASFQMDNDTLARAYINNVRQHSKETRNRFDQPLTYTLGHKNWHALELVRGTNGQMRVDTVHFGTQTTVRVDWLTERSTTEYTVPRIDITFGNGNGWSGSQWIGRYGKTYYEDATIRIQGGGVFPDMEETAIQIKGRGNSSWSNSSSSKNPYHFKFEDKQKPLGMKSGRHWLLLANKQTGSMTTNAIAHRAAQLLGMAFPCHIVPVELYVNGSYRGSYNLTERIALANNSVDLEDDSQAGIIELDTYTDEPILHENAYYLPVKMKDSDDVDGLHSTAVDAFNTLTRAVSWGEDYDQLVDLDKLASFLITNELILNCEIKHPKSVFAYNANLYDEQDGIDPTPWVFGPLWDCDWAFGYQQSQSYFVSSPDMDFYNQMGNSDNYGDNPLRFWKALRNGSRALDEIMYSRLYHFITMGGLDELLEYCDDYYQFAKNSFVHNRTTATSQSDMSNYQTQTNNAKSWLLKRVSSMFSRYEAYDLSSDDDADHHPTDGVRDFATDTHRQPGAIYDLQGRRQTAPLQPGIYVRDGQKFMVR